LAISINSLETTIFSPKKLHGHHVEPLLTVSHFLYIGSYNEEMAINYLRKNLLSKLSTVQEYTRLDLAKIYFDRSDFKQVVDVLQVIYENKTERNHHMQELLGRFIFTISLLVIGQEGRAIA